MSSEARRMPTYTLDHPELNLIPEDPARSAVLAPLAIAALVARGYSPAETRYDPWISFLDALGPCGAPTNRLYRVAELWGRLGGEYAAASDIIRVEADICHAPEGAVALLLGGDDESHDAWFSLTSAWWEHRNDMDKIALVAADVCEQWAAAIWDGPYPNPAYDGADADALADAAEAWDYRAAAFRLGGSSFDGFYWPATWRPKLDVTF